MRGRMLGRIDELWKGASKRTKLLVVAAVYLIFFTVGTVGHYIDITRPLMLDMTPWFLAIFGISAIAVFVRRRSIPILIWAVGTYAVTFTLEAVGVATGVVFGAYEYGETLGLQWLEVPLIIGFNWVIVVLGSIKISMILIDRFLTSFIFNNGSRLLISVVRTTVGALMTGLLAVAFDVVLEPVAIRFDYWMWNGGTIPTRNYIAWFSIAFVCSLPVFAGRLRLDSAVPVIYVVVQFLFIASLIPLAL